MFNDTHGAIFKLSCKIYHISMSFDTHCCKVAGTILLNLWNVKHFVHVCSILSRVSRPEKYSSCWNEAKNRHWQLQLHDDDERVNQMFTLVSFQPGNITFDVACRLLSKGTGRGCDDQGDPRNLWAIRTKVVDISVFAVNSVHGICCVHSSSSSSSSSSHPPHHPPPPPPHHHHHHL